MREEKNTLIHLSIANRGKDLYITPCGKVGGDYYITHDKKKVTCKECIKSYEEK